MARVKPIVNRDDIAPEHHALFDELAALRGRISGPSTIVLYSPGLARPWNEISEYLHRQSIVEPEHAELAVCATAREKDCGYVWNAHVPLARKAGILPATLDVVRERRSVSGLYEPEAAVILYVRQLVQDNRVESDVFDQLLAAHGPQWMVELTYWIGRYQALAGILNGFEVTAAAPAEVLPPAPRSDAAPAEVRAPFATPRVEPITRPDQLVETHRSVLDAVMKDRGGRVPGPFRMLLHSPALCRRHLDVGTHLRTRSRLEPAATELAIIASAREKDCPYVWAAHAPAARKAGVSDAACGRGARSRRSRGAAGRRARRRRLRAPALANQRRRPGRVRSAADSARCAVARRAHVPRRALRHHRGHPERVRGRAPLPTPSRCPCRPARKDHDAAHRTPQAISSSP
jgi:AhpD family alkylhydroperoxidase